MHSSKIEQLRTSPDLPTFRGRASPKLSLTRGMVSSTTCKAVGQMRLASVGSMTILNLLPLQGLQIPGTRIGGTNTPTGIPGMAGTGMTSPGTGQGNLTLTGVFGGQLIRQPSQVWP